MKVINIIFGAIHVAQIFLAKLLLVGMILIVFVTVVMRLAFNKGISWSEEVALVFMIWFTFIGLGIGVEQKLHIAITIFTDLLPSKAVKILQKIIDLTMLLFAIILLKYGIGLVQYTLSSTLAATGWPSAVMYLVVPVSAVLVIYYAFTDLIGSKRLSGDVSNILEEVGEE